MTAQLSSGARVDVLAAMDRMAEAAKFERDDHKYHRADIAGWWDRLFIDTTEARAAVAELVAADRAYDLAASMWRGERYETDNYGVDGSEFYICCSCESESGAGVLNKGVLHEDGCLVAALENAESRRTAALAPFSEAGR